MKASADMNKCSRCQNEPRTAFNSWGVKCLSLTRKETCKKRAVAQITLFTTQQVKAYLLQLVATGLYGNTLSEACERLIAKAIEEMIHEQVKASLKGGLNDR